MDTEHAHLRKVVYKCNLRLSHVAHIRISDSQRLSPPSVNLFRGSGPDNITVKSNKVSKQER